MLFLSLVYKSEMTRTRNEFYINGTNMLYQCSFYALYFNAFYASYFSYFVFHNRFSDIVWNDSFVPGERYYITMKACNGAALCREHSSNGVTLDNSPPIGGLVRIGPQRDHQTYQPHK